MSSWSYTRYELLRTVRNRRYFLFSLIFPVLLFFLTYLPQGKYRIVDIGDADIVHTDTAQSHAGIEAGVRAILKAGAMPVVIGGDHSINIPCINAFDGQGDIHVVQIDAHLDFVDERHGVRYGHGNPMRRAAEKPYVTGLSQIGIRNVSSTAHGEDIGAHAP